MVIGVKTLKKKVFTSINFLILIVFAVAILLLFLPIGKIPENKIAIPNLNQFTPPKIDKWILLSQRSFNEAQLDILVEKDTYSQTYEAIYLGPKNHRIFISLSYGENQLDGRFQAHRPEYCYSSQGYEIKSVKDDNLITPWNTIPIRLLQADKPKKNEYITYWMTLSKDAVLPGLSRMMAQITYGLKGEIPDGLLIRVSSISEDEKESYAIQNMFIKQWLKSLPEPLRTRLIGS